MGRRLCVGVARRQRIVTPPSFARDTPTVAHAVGNTLALLALATAHDDHPEQLAELTAKNVAVYHRAAAIGGLRYPVDGVPAPVDRRGWAAHFGPLWGRALAAKKRFDPDAILAPNLGIFTAP